ncbi:hypothetical protein SAMN05216559_3597 [Halomicrobium zhouii]|uniref:Uncharacterized protein n=2 Tax=Halomicrobium zhouii TaxID=767519 RepID=A0A1I6M2H6_9EURY|nr:hypothetical protein SAMN05216559_3597 [Halomicrobium zhouii]
MGRSLPQWLETYTKFGLFGLVVGTALCLLALFTNPVPDPSFPWFSLPEVYRFPITQPRIEHWPVSYTVGIWLWITCAPALFLRGYERFVWRPRYGPTTWLVGLPTLAMIGLTTYCRFFWPKPQPATWNAPAYTFVCWAYCSTYDPLWSNLAYAIASIGVITFVMLVRRSSLAVATEATFGVLALPLGLPTLFDAYRRATMGQR